MIIAESEKKHGAVFEKNREGLTLYLVDFLRTFAISLPGIFVPLFIFQYPGKPVLLVSSLMASNLLWVVLYYVIFSYSAAFFNLFATRVVFKQFGFKRSMLWGMVFLMAGIACLMAAGQSFGLLLLAPFFFGLSVHLYWIPFHIFFVRKSNTGGNFGKETAFLLFIQSLAASLGPLISGLIISQWGFEPVFALTTFVLFLASIPAFLFVSEGLHRDHNVFELMRSYLKDARTRRAGLAIGARAGEAILFEIFWPILLFIVLRDFVKVGAITAVSFFVSSLVMLWAGKKFETNSRSKIFPASVFINAGLYVIRLFLLFPLGVYLIDIFHRINGKIYTIGFTSAVYDAAETYGASDFTIYREIVSHFGQAALLLAAGLLLVFLPDWKLIFLVCAFCSLGSLSLYRIKNKA
jgi:MFS family permease